MEVPSVASCNREYIVDHSSRPHYSRGRNTINIRRWAPLRPQCTLLVKCFSFLFSDRLRPQKLHNGGDHQHIRSQRNRIHRSTLSFEPHELQQLFLPNSWITFWNTIHISRRGCLHLHTSLGVAQCVHNQSHCWWSEARISEAAVAVALDSPPQFP